MRESILTGFQLVALEATLLSSILWVFSNEIALFYAKDNSVSSTATELLAIVAFYHLGDALQTICFFILRSFKVTFLPMLLYSFMLWGIGLSGGYILAYHGFPGITAMQSPKAFWLMSLIALLMVGMSLLYLVWHHSKNKIRESY